MMTPEEFAQKAREIYTSCAGYAGETGHMAMDALMEQCLESLGYGEGVEILESMTNIWYA